MYLAPESRLSSLVSSPESNLVCSATHLRNLEQEFSKTPSATGAISISLSFSASIISISTPLYSTLVYLLFYFHYLLDPTPLFALQNICRY